MKKSFLILCLFIVFTFSVDAQKQTCNCTLQGVVHEKDIHQIVPGAVIYIKGTNIATFADAKGKYSFKNLCKGNYILICQAVGFQRIEVPISLSTEHQEDFSLEDKDEHLQEVVVSEKKMENVTQA